MPRTAAYYHLAGLNNQRALQHAPQIQMDAAAPRRANVRQNLMVRLSRVVPLPPRLGLGQQHIMIVQAVFVLFQPPIMLRQSLFLVTNAPGNLPSDKHRTQRGNDGWQPRCKLCHDALPRHSDLICSSIKCQNLARQPLWSSTNAALTPGRKRVSTGSRRVLQHNWQHISSPARVTMWRSTSKGSGGSCCKFMSFPHETPAGPSCNRPTHGRLEQEARKLAVG